MSAIKTKKPTSKSRFRQGYYKINNLEKYIGDPTKIIYRSSWEYRFCRYCDETEEVLKWSSEPYPIKYISPLDKKQHEYYVDFYMRLKTDNAEQDYLVEVKPEASLKKPVFEGLQTMKRLKNFNYAAQTWLVNCAKFAAAKTHAESMRRKFVIVTEEFLFKQEKNG
jgi:hypothetical protein